MTVYTKTETLLDSTTDLLLIPSMIAIKISEGPATVPFFPQPEELYITLTASSTLQLPLLGLRIITYCHSNISFDAKGVHNSQTLTY